MNTSMRAKRKKGGEKSKKKKDSDKSPLIGCKLNHLNHSGCLLHPVCRGSTDFFPPPKIGVSGLLEYSVA